MKRKRTINSTKKTRENRTTRRNGRAVMTRNATMRTTTRIKKAAEVT